MKIGVVGAGNIGSTLARHFVRLGHDVAVSNSRGPDSLSPLVSELGANARAMTAEEAAFFGELVVVSVPLFRYRAVQSEPLGDKVVIDTMNYYPDRDGRIRELDEDETTSSEMLARHLDSGSVVKLFNTIYWERLRDGARPRGAGRIVLPMSGDDDAAKKAVASLTDEIGFEAIDLGTLEVAGRRQQPGGPLFTADLPADELRRLAAG